MKFPALDIAKALIPIIGCFAALIGLFLYIGDSDESLLTLNIRQLTGIVVLGGLAFVLVGRQRSVQLFERREVSVVSMFGAVGFGLFCLLTPYYLHVFGVQFDRFSPLGPYQPYGLDEPMFLFAFFLMGLYVLAEELYFRGLVYTTLRRFAPIAAAVAASALFFAAVHIISSPLYFIILVMAGVFAALTYEYTGTLLLGNIAHLTANFGVLIISSTTVDPVRPTLFPFLAVLAILLCAVAVVRLRGKHLSSQMVVLERA